MIGRQGVVILLLLVAGFGLADLVRGIVEEPTVAALHESEPELVATTLGGGDDVGPTALEPGPGTEAADERSRSSSTAAPTPPDVRPVEAFAGPPRASGGRSISRASLASRVRALLGHENLNGAAVGVSIYSITRGESLLRVDATTPRIPASNAKLATTAAVLAILGQEFAFETRLVPTADVDRRGVLEGDLVVVGDGDPDPREATGTPLVERLAAAARDAGLTHVRGRLIVDDRVFDREVVAPGWKEANLHKAYSAPVAGFSSYGNTLAVAVVPGATVGAAAEVSLTPPGAPFALEASVKTIGKKGKHIIDVRPMPAVPGRITVRGSTPQGVSPVPVEVAIDEPGQVAGQRLRAALERVGVTVDGEVVVAARGARYGHEGRAAIARATTPIAELLPILNKESSNVVAEHLFKRCGYAHEGIGSFDSAGRAVRAGLERLGIEWRGSRAADGSGLSRENRYSADLFVALLDRLYRSSLREVTLDSLAVTGVDGTLRKRLSEPHYRGRVRGKTGYVTRVSSVSGYAQADHGEVLAFSILMNGFKGWSGHVRAVQDDILRLLVDLDQR